MNSFWPSLLYNIDDVVDCMDFEEVVVFTAEFKGYYRSEKNLFVIVKVTSITTERNIVNVTTDDGDPFYMQNQTRIWCLSKLSLHSKKTKHVSFTESLSECVTYYSKCSNRNNMKKILGHPCGSKRRSIQKTSTRCYNSDILTDVEDVVNRTNISASTYNSDIFTCVKDVLERILITTKIKDVILKSVFKQSVHRNRQFLRVQMHPPDVIQIFRFRRT
ncbi:hypothetical protein O6H91_04G050900 [Diphasiastrum complanatum]|uniref:Uncharacterized protein n=1 Tax=Diphasiastrum complanatum TaxID=34168 RepID=A0ACC2DWR9_DIPCM|nr:hypothetical protein O6H91_04G050900 [Diphasiastrum complanatum]